MRRPGTHALERSPAGSAGAGARARVPGTHEVRMRSDVTTGSRPSRLLLRALASVQQKAFPTLFAVALVASWSAYAVPTPAGTAIDNVANLSLMVGNTTLNAPSNTDRVTVAEPLGRTQAIIEFAQYAPGASSAEPRTAGPTRCDTGAGYTTLADPTALDGSTIDAESLVPLVDGEVFHRGEPLFIAVEDDDHDINSAVLDTILVEVAVSGSGDRETLELTETGPATGVFVGFIMTAAPPAVANDCTLAVGNGDRILATYTDFQSATVAAAALVDPFGVVFDAITGAPISGATVTLIDVATGLPAAVFGDDGVSTYPATVITGGTATDGSGTVYAFPPGEYRFPFVRPGNYRLDVTPPAGYLHPSVVPINALPGGFAIEVGSHGQTFMVLPGPALHIDIPLDPSASELLVRKTTTVGETAVGDFVGWSVAVQNASPSAAGSVVVTDTMATGLRYRAGSARRDGAPIADPTISADGQTLTFVLGTIPANSTSTISYVTQVGVGVRGRTLSNSAQATASGGVASNLAQASVRLRQDLFGDRATLLGEILEDSCEFGTGQGSGVAGVRVLLEDGTYAITDEKGRYHFRGVSEGNHVVQLDVGSLPIGYEVEACEHNTRFAGRDYSQFVDLQRGALWRADFRVKRPDPAKGLVTTSLKGSINADDSGVALYEYAFAGDGKVALANLRLSFLVPDGATLVPNSVVLDGTAMAGAAIVDGVMTLRLGDRPVAFQQRLAFRIELPEGLADPAVRAVLTLDAATKKNLRPEPVEVKLDATAPEAALVQGQVWFESHFASRSWALSAADRDGLSKLAERGVGLKNLRLHVIGFTDSVRVGRSANDDLKDNADLSRRRAAAVADFLAAELGIDRSRITVEGRGESEPIGDNKADDGKQANRRVSIAASGIKTAAGKDSSAEASATLELTGLRPGERAAKIAGAVPATIVPDYRIDYAPYAKTVDGALLATLEPGRAMLWPPVDANPAIPAIKVAVQHLKGETVELTINGRPVPNTNIAGADSAPDRDIGVKQWAGVDLVEGPNAVVATVRDASGVPVATIERSVHYAGIAVRGEVLGERSVLTADGKTRPVIAVRMFDRWGHPVRPGASGPFDVGAPYRAWRDIDDRYKDKLFVVGEVRSTWIAGADGVALIELAPTTDSGQVQLKVRFGERNEQDLYAWLEPIDRDWILVGLAEGTVGHAAVSQNLTAFEAAGGTPDYFDDGRVAFYAKGMIKGDTLLTIAYDTSKDRQTGGANLEQQIDPNAYYLLYGDAAEQRNDAASLRNLYLRVERKQFYAMFGDFDTSLTVTELGRYSRRLNGFKSEYRGESLLYSAFASEDTTAFRKDEIPGDGTSGLYHLSNDPLAINSEHVRIQVRDRFHSETVLSETTLTRHLDYTIDYGAGTLFFRRPVPSRDPGFNPVFIVVDYETQSSGEGTFTGGGRGAVLLNGGAVEIGATAIHEGTTGADGDLVAADLRVRLNPTTELKAEVGASDTGVGAAARDGTAYSVKVEHLGDLVQGRAYLRQQDAAYGIGQQSGGESGTRKIGVEGTIKLDERVDGQAQAYVQDNLSTGSQRQVVEASARYSTVDNKYTATGGVRHAAESGLAAGDLVSDQVYAGGTARLTEDVTLRAQVETSIAGSAEATAYPDRLTVGADYQLTEQASAFLEHEIADGAAQSSSMTRLGVRTTPWDRARADAAVEQHYAEDGPRLFATLGLSQGWQATDDLLLDFGVDRVQTLRAPGDPDFDLDVPPASGSDPNGDFTAWYTGATYRQGDWTMNGRLETFRGDLEDRWGVSAGAYRAQGERWGIALRGDYRTGEKVTGQTGTDATLSLGLAYRPTDPRFVWLDRVDLVYQDLADPLAGNSRSHKLINNLNLNHRPDARWQTSYQYAFKWVRADLGDEYTEFTDLIGIDSRYDLNPDWDVGAQLYALHSWEDGTIDYATGVSLGHSFARNVWLSVGYNFDGFHDEDFAGARYTAQGPYLQIRIKFDQDSYKELKSLVAPAASSMPGR